MYVNAISLFREKGKFDLLNKDHFLNEVWKKVENDQLYI